MNKEDKKKETEELLDILKLIEIQKKNSVQSRIDETIKNINKDKKLSLEVK